MMMSATGLISTRFICNFQVTGSGLQHTERQQQEKGGASDKAGSLTACALVAVVSKGIWLC
jgi:hypothetical protein